MKKPPASTEASPYKSVTDELESLRRTFRSFVHRYTARVEGEINQVRDTVLAAAQTAPQENAAKAPAKLRPRKNPLAAERQAAQIHDLRDMLTLLRTFEIGSEVAKRRDFKLIENILEELRLLARRWQ